MSSSLFGPLVLDIAGLSLTEDDKQLLQNPFVGGVILFSRNYQSPGQVTQLINDMRSIRPELLIAVDQEGGRVQRFKSSLTRLPPLASLGQLYDQNTQEALMYATELGWLMASEMLVLGVDISFAPVLDLAYGVSSVIGDRSLHASPDVVIVLAKAYIRGMNQSGMAATGKHFPGHGAVSADSHHTLPVDTRELDDIRQNDLKPFNALVDTLAGIMPAHIVYDRVDSNPAGFSTFWLQSLLRNEMGFKGLIFSDDLSMKGAAIAGNYVDRAFQALHAGCDMILVCNDREGVETLLADQSLTQWQVNQQRVRALKGKPQVSDVAALQAMERYTTARDLVAHYSAAQ